MLESRVTVDFNSSNSNSSNSCRCIITTITCFIILLIIAAIATTLAFTVFRPKDPTTEVVSSHVTGANIAINPSSFRVELNLTLNLDILAHNPNIVSFIHDLGHTELFYRGTQVGQADIEPGAIPAHGSEHMQVLLTVEADKLLDGLVNGRLSADVLDGEIGLDTKTRIPGRLSFLGVFKPRAVAVEECQVVIGLPENTVRRQKCTHQTRL